MRMRPASRAAPALIVLLSLMIGCQDPPESTSNAMSGAASDSTDTTADDAVDAGEAVDHAAPDTSPDDATPALTADGWGDLRIGMTRAQVVAAAGQDANPGAVGGPDPATCDEFRPDQAPDGLLVMIRNGRLSRIAMVDGPDIVTDRGLTVGDSISAVEAAYGDDAVASPHAFLPDPAALVTAWERAPPSPDARGIAYEIGAQGRIVRILAGDESIEFREGCV